MRMIIMGIWMEIITLNVCCSVYNVWLFLSFATNKENEQLAVVQYGFVLGSFAVLRPVDSRVWYGANSRAEQKRMWNGRIGIRVVLTFSAARSLRAPTIVHDRYHRGFRFTAMIWQPTIAKLVRKNRSPQSLMSVCIIRTTPRINNCDFFFFSALSNWNAISVAHVHSTICGRWFHFVAKRAQHRQTCHQPYENWRKKNKKEKTAIA